MLKSFILWFYNLAIYREQSWDNQIQNFNKNLLMLIEFY